MKVAEKNGDRSYFLRPPIVIHLLYYIILSQFSSAAVDVVSTALGESQDHSSTQERKIHSLHTI